MILVESGNRTQDCLAGGGHLNHWANEAVPENRRKTTRKKKNKEEGVEEKEAIKGSIATKSEILAVSNCLPTTQSNTKTPSSYGQ